MGVEIKLDYGAIAGLEKAAERAAKMTIDAVKADVVTAQVMPFDTGTMQNTDTFVDESRESDVIVASINTAAPQARRLYYHPEYNFQTVNNPNARGEWLEPWLEGDRSEFAEETFREFFKKEAGL